MPVSKILKLDWFLLAFVALLLAISLLALYSISVAGKGEGANIFQRQIIFALIGIVIMFIFSSFNSHYFRLHSTKIYFITLAVLALLLIWGKIIRGTSGWIGFGSWHVQPVEIAKLSLIVFLASFISQKKNQMMASARLIISFFLTAVMIFFVLKQPDFGSAAVLAGIWLGIMLVSGINKKHFLLLVLASFIAVFSAWFFLADYQKARIINVIRPEIDPRGSGYNVIQSMVAMGSGGVLGKGIGHGSQSQLNFLPEKHTDFIFAVIVEESGLIGAVLILSLFAAFFYRLKKIADSSHDNFNYLLVAGIMMMFAIQIFINIGMNVGVVPVAGIPLPFLSYGGSSLVVSFASVGIALGIFRRRKNMLKSQITQSY